VNITKIKLSDGEVTIEELYNMIFDENKHVITLQNGTQIVETLSKDHYISGVNGETKIKNISRRKVSKKCYNIEIPGKEELKLTEDHSIIVYRDNKLIECKPYEILETDFLVIN
jgi:intein/homing endonuclease